MYFERCVEICPEVFKMGDELAQVKVSEIPQEYEQTVVEAAEECPVSAIKIEKKYLLEFFI